MEITWRRKDMTGLLRTFLLFVFEEGFSLNGASRCRQSQRRWAHLALAEAPPAAPSSAVPGGITDALGKETASSSRHVHCVSSAPVQNTLSPGASSTKHQPKDQSTEHFNMTPAEDYTKSGALPSTGPAQSSRSQAVKLALPEFPQPWTLYHWPLLPLPRCRVTFSPGRARDPEALLVYSPSGDDNSLMTNTWKKLPHFFVQFYSYLRKYVKSGTRYSHGWKQKLN